MKRTICIILIISTAFCVFARDNYITSSEEGRHAEDLLDDGLYANQVELGELAPLLTPADITLLYSKNKRSSLKDSLMNGLIGFGAGSFNAGDRKGGWIQVALETGGVIIGGTSVIYLAGSMLVGVLTLGHADNIGSLMGASAIGAITGLGAFIGGRIYGIVRGIKYPKQYNKDLQETLYGISQSGPQLSLSPVFTPQGFGFGLGVSF